MLTTSGILKALYALRHILLQIEQAYRLCIYINQRRMKNIMPGEKILESDFTYRYFLVVQKRRE